MRLGFREIHEQKCWYLIAYAYSQRCFIISSVITHPCPVEFEALSPGEIVPEPYLITQCLINKNITYTVLTVH